MATFSANSYSFGFPSRSKHPPLDILKLLINTLSNQYKKVSFIQVYKDGSLEISSVFMITCHNMNIIVQTKFGDASSLCVKVEIPNNTLYNITRDILLNSIHNKYILCFSNQCAIWIFLQTDNILRGDGPYFLFHGSIPS